MDSSSKLLLTSARKCLDPSFHSSYSADRQRWQDLLVFRMCSNSRQRSSPSRGSTVQPQGDTWCVFTAGPMGVGKSTCLRYLLKTGLLPLENAVVVDLDEIRAHFPEAGTLLKHCPLAYGSATQREAGTIAELCLLFAAATFRHVVFEGTLRDVEWYASYLQSLKPTIEGLRGLMVDQRYFTSHATDDFDIFQSELDDPITGDCRMEAHELGSLRVGVLHMTASLAEVERRVRLREHRAFEGSLEQGISVIGHPAAARKKPNRVAPTPPIPRKAPSNARPLHAPPKPPQSAVPFLLPEFPCKVGPSVSGSDHHGSTGSHNNLNSYNHRHSQRIVPPNVFQSSLAMTDFSQLAPLARLNKYRPPLTPIFFQLPMETLLVRPTDNDGQCRAEMQGDEPVVDLLVSLDLSGPLPRVVHPWHMDWSAFTDCFLRPRSYVKVNSAVGASPTLRAGPSPSPSPSPSLSLSQLQVDTLRGQPCVSDISELTGSWTVSVSCVGSGSGSASASASRSGSGSGSRSRLHNCESDSNNTDTRLISSGMSWGIKAGIKTEDGRSMVNLLPPILSSSPPLCQLSHSSRALETQLMISESSLNQALVLLEPEVDPEFCTLTSSQNQLSINKGQALADESNAEPNALKAPLRILVSSPRGRVPSRERGRKTQWSPLSHADGSETDSAFDATGLQGSSEPPPAPNGRKAMRDRGFGLGLVPMFSRRTGPVLTSSTGPGVSRQARQLRVLGDSSASSLTQFISVSSSDCGSRLLVGTDHTRCGLGLDPVSTVPQRPNDAYDADTDEFDDDSGKICKEGRDSSSHKQRASFSSTATTARIFSYTHAAIITTASDCSTAFSCSTDDSCSSAGVSSSDQECPVLMLLPLVSERVPEPANTWNTDIHTLEHFSTKQRDDVGLLRQGDTFLRPRSSLCSLCRLDKYPSCSPLGETLASRAGGGCARLWHTV